MRVRLPRIKNVFRVDDDFAIIETVDKFGRVIYTIGYFANITEAIANDAIQIRITLYSSDPTIRQSIFDGAKTSKEISTNILMHAAKLKTKIANRNNRYLVRTISDISSGISNEVAIKIKKNPELAKQLLPKRKIFQRLAKRDMSNLGIRTVPKLSISTIKPDLTIKKPMSVKKSAINAILKDGIDPSIVGDLDFPVISPKKSVQGTLVVPGIGTKTPARVPTSQIKKSKAVRGFSGAKMGSSRVAKIEKATRMKPKIVNKFKKSIPSKKIVRHFTLDLVKKSPIPIINPKKENIIIKEVPAMWKEYLEELPINLNRLNGVYKLYALFELIGERGMVIDHTLKIINHDKLLKQYFQPQSPPILSLGKSKIGYNTINCEQIDPLATSIWLYRKILHTADHTIGKKYKLLSKIDLTTDEKYYTYIDRVNNTATCIYRAIALGPMEVRSSKFSNIVAKALPHPGIGTKSPVSNTELTHVSIFAETVEQKVKVRVANIPDGPCALYVQSEDLTLKTTPRIVGLDTQQQIRVVTNKSIDMYFEDLNVKTGHIYRYTCTLIYPSGKEVQSAAEEIHEFLIDYESQNVVLEVGAPIVTVDSAGSISTAFSVNANFTDQGLNGIISALDSAGISSEFTKDISADRAKLLALLAFSIERQDTISGETEAYGVLQTKEAKSFIDNASYRRLAGVSDLVPGRTYKYVVTLLIRDPGTLFPDATESSDDITTDRAYSVKVAKFLNPLVVNEGTLPSTSRVKGLSSASGMVLKNPFLEGKTSINEVIDVIIPSQRSVIKSIVAHRVPGGDIMIRWSIAGDPEEIDHFVILASYQGVKSPIGTAHSVTDSLSFEYLDRILSHEVGEVVYSITPVFSDYTYGAETEGVSIVNELAYPEFTIVV